MNFHFGRIMPLAGGITLFTVALGWMNLNLAGESGRSEEEKRAGGKIICLDEDLELRVSFSNFWRAVKNILKPIPQEE
jgi:hypothetical protein